MGIWDYISSTANAVNQNILTPLLNLCSISYSYGRSATTNIIAAVPNLSSNDEDGSSNAAQFATTCAKNAAVFVCREGLKSVPGGRPVYDIVARSVGDSQKKDEHNKPQLRALSKAVEDNKKQIKDNEKQIKEMREEINNLKQVVNDQVGVEDKRQDISSRIPKLKVRSRI